MNEKNGFIINSLQKDYEITSWNEQGEITRLEGILTIAFFISVCSHRDRKQLYLIARIPYTVNMQYKEKKYFVPGNIKIIDGFPGAEETEQKIKKLEQRIKELEEENKEQKKFRIELEGTLADELEKLRKENQTLKEKLGIVDSEWQIEKDLAWRNNPITGKFEQYGFPTFFSVDNVKNLRFTDETKYMYHFDYRISEGKVKEYDMPVSLYNHIKKLYGLVSEDELMMDMIQKLKQKKPRETDEISINSLDDMKKAIEKFGEKSYDYNDFLSSVTEFVIGLKGKKFGTHDFKRENKIKSPTTVSKYLKMLEKCKIIEKEKMGNWRVIIGY